MKDGRFALLVIILLALFVRVYKIGGLEIGGAWDEGYSMIAATHVLEDRTLLLIPDMPGNNGVILDKPPVLYYLGALSMALFGPSEGSVRAVTILFGVLSVIPFYLLINRLIKNRGLALLSAFILASFPIHIAISRTYMLHVPALFFALVTVYLLIRGIDGKKVWLLVVAGAVTAVNLLTGIWFGTLPVAGIMVWKGIEVIRSRESRKYYWYSVLSLFAGLLIFLIWPLSVGMHQDQFVSIHGDCYPPNCTMWNIISIDMLLNRAAVKRWGGDLAGIPLRPGASVKSLMGRISRSYLPLGHFNFSREFDLFYRLFFFGGVILGLTQLRQKSARSLHLFFLFWTASYLPIHMGKNLYTQYLILMVPVFSFYTALAIYEIRSALARISGVSGVATGVTVLLCGVFFLKGLSMIEYKREYLYKTHSREIAAYLKGKTRPDKVVCKNYPGMSYYLKGECVRRDMIENLGRNIKETGMQFADVKDSEDRKTLLQIGCRPINSEIGIPVDAEHQVFDCRGV